MRIISVNKYGLLRTELQKPLESAIKWFENAVSVSEVSKYVYKDIDTLVDGYKTTVKESVTVQTPNKVFSTDINSNEFKEIFDYADVVVFITKQSGTCDGDAQGGQVELSNRLTGHPKLGELKLCPSKYDPEMNYFDLFRHEILHVLGYGTINRTVPATESYTWRYEDNTETTATRTFFPTSAIDQVKKHFGCDDLNGVESDADGKHLNEYIFFNELMTPGIDKGENFFSYISAEILEDIYRGDKQWYKVNRTFIAPEADAYVFGKGFGCTFLKKSCYDFFDERKSPSGERPAPFCPEESPNTPKICFNTGNPNGEMPVFTCKSDYKPVNGAYDIPQPPNSKYNNGVRRFCPFYSSYYDFEKYPRKPCQ